MFAICIMGTTASLWVSLLLFSPYVHRKTFEGEWNILRENG